MKARDKNQDGKLDFQEFVGERAKDQDKVNAKINTIIHIDIVIMAWYFEANHLVKLSLIFFRSFLKAKKKDLTPTWMRTRMDF